MPQVLLLYDRGGKGESFDAHMHRKLIFRRNRMEYDYKKLRRRIFDLMNGSIDTVHFPMEESSLVENEYAEGKLCEQLYGEIYDCSLRLCERLGAGESDRDVERIINAFFDIQERLCMKMYDYGRLFALKEIEEACRETEPQSILYMTGSDELKVWDGP